jgi:2-polyprenyl-3-methyl-5-hydroxy-6-metoxy-1,4-benzoquinol methylase
MEQSPRKFDWQEMQEYWQIHDIRWSNIDFDIDPDGLTNVCYPGAPLWLNHYYARSQMMVYEKLYNRLLGDMPTKRALEVGCGAGRWCRFLAERGWEVIGIDLQSKLIQVNRKRYPHIQFDCVSVQNYVPEKSFRLISAVTVVQHIPFDEQSKVFKKFREIIELGGYVIMLDSVHYQTPHVFSRTMREWIAEVEKAGFVCIAVQRYDYTPFFRFHSKLVSLLSTLISKRRSTVDIASTPKALADAPIPYVSEAGHKNFFRMVVTSILVNMLPRLFLHLDCIVESIAMRANFPYFARHCGFLFKAVQVNHVEY